MESVRPRDINIYAILGVMFINLLDCINMNVGIEEYILYVGTFIIYLVFLVFIKSKYVDVAVLTIVGIISLFDSEVGNLTGVPFLMLAMSLCKSRNFNICVFVLGIFVAIAKNVFMGYTIPDAMNNLVGFAYLYFMYFAVLRGVGNVAKSR